MLARARHKGIDESRLILFPNWIDVGAVRAGRAAVDYRSQLDIPRGAVVAMYSGNMGGKQGLETLADVARMLRRRADIHFIFCGEGHQRDELQRRCTDLPNVRFLPLQPAECLAALLATADIHLLPQRAGAADLVMPSKLTGMLASGRPVICGTAQGTELATVVSQCGRVVRPESAPAMARALLRLAASPGLRRALGDAALRYAQAHLHTDTVLDRFEQQLMALCAPRAALPKMP
jgi:colanic acid biosynthesis glycosyl transferase WcaI